MKFGINNISITITIHKWWKLGITIWTRWKFPCGNIFWLWTTLNAMYNLWRSPFFNSVFLNNLSRCTIRKYISDLKIVYFASAHQKGSRYTVQSKLGITIWTWWKFPCGNIFWLWTTLNAICTTFEDRLSIIQYS